MKLFVIIMAISLLSAIVALCAGAFYRKHNKNVRNMANAANQPGVGESGTGYKTMLATAVAGWTTYVAAYTNSNQPPGRFAIVKLGAAGYATISASATDIPIGIAQDAPDADGDPINIRLLNSMGTARVVAAAAITLGDYVQSNGDGAVKTAVSTGYIIGRALMAAGAAGDVIEIMLMTPDRAL